MRASLRWKNILLGGLMLVPAAALAQSAPDPSTSSTPATDAVGPRELQDFSLSGNVTRPSDQAAAPAPAADTPAPAKPAADEAQTAAGPVRRAAPPREQVRETAATSPAPAPSSAAAKPPTQAPLTTFTPSLSAPLPASATPGPAATPTAQTSFPAATAPAVPGSVAPEHKLLIWPWLLAALALAGATLFLLWRRRQQEAFAGGPQFDLFVAPEPAPAPPRPAPAPPRAATPPVDPRPAPEPPKPAAPASSGIVSTRLRPSIEIAVQPLRCLVDEERVVLEFELELYNSGTAPARAVLAEASLFNAGVQQDQELAAFFANPVGAGERLEAIPPMKRMTFTNQVVAPRAAIQEYELGGRKVFVPVIAFNALYLWSGGHAQTSAAYLVGRDTNGEKLGPLSLDGGPRQIGKLAARPLPAELRT
jgi:hypothetical protein